MARYTKTSLGSNYASKQQIDTNLDDIKTAIDDTLSRKGDSPNAMEADLDMNSNRILNLPNAINPAEPVTLAQFNANSGGTKTTSTLRQLHTATAGQTVFATPEYVIGSNNLAVYINGVRQNSEAYSETTTTSMTLSEGAELGDKVEVLVNELQESTDQVGATNVTYDGTTVGVVLDALTVDTVALAKVLDLQVGKKVKTWGYTTAGDGGGAEYQVVAGGTGTDDGGSYHDMTNGNQLELIVNDTVNARQFGAVGDGVADDSAALTALWKLSYKTCGVEGDTYKFDSGTQVNITNNVNWSGRNSTVSFTQNSDGFLIKFAGNTVLEDTIFDFNDKYFCNVTGREIAPFLFSGSKANVRRCTFKRLLGIENRFQYAFKILHNTQSNIEQCSFDDIQVATNTANTSGFCGAIFLGSDPDNLGNVEVSSHLISNCEFSNIYTVANGAAQTFPDSDAIRTYYYEFDTPGTYPTSEDNAKQSTILISDCTFVDVLKSAVKANYAQVTVNSCSFEVANDNGQTLIYAAFRYQAGDYFVVNNVRVTGSKIAHAVLADGLFSSVENVYFDSTYSNSSAIFCGGTDGNNINVDTLHVDNCVNMILASASAMITAKNLFCDTGNLTGVVLKYITPTDVLIENVNIGTSVNAGLFDEFNTSSTISNVKFKNVNMISSTASGLIQQHSGNGIMTIEGCNFSGTYNRFLVGGTGLSELYIYDSKFQTSTTGTQPQLLANGIDVVKLVNVRWVDERGTKTGMIEVTDNEIFEVNGLEYIATTLGSGVTAFIDATGRGTGVGYCRISDVFFDSTETATNSALVTTYKTATIDNFGIDMPNDLNAVINVTGNGGSVVNLFYGNVKAATPVVGATFEYNTSKTS